MNWLKRVINIFKVWFKSERLTKREQIAAYALQGLISKLPIFDNLGTHGMKISPENMGQLKTDVAKSALGYADAFLEEANK